VRPTPADRKNVFAYVRAFTGVKGSCTVSDLMDCMRGRGPQREAAIRKVLAELVEARIIRPGSEPDTWETPHGV
jgi:hypothetical protein